MDRGSVSPFRGRINGVFVLRKLFIFSLSPCLQGVGTIAPAAPFIESRDAICDTLPPALVMNSLEF